MAGSNWPRPTRAAFPKLSSCAYARGHCCVLLLLRQLLISMVFGPSENYELRRTIEISQKTPMHGAMFLGGGSSTAGSFVLSR